MKEFLTRLEAVSLFAGMTGEEILAMTDCLGAAARPFDKGAAVLRAGERADRIGAVLTGGVLVCREDSEGGRIILADIPAGGLFAEAYACAPTESLPVSVYAAQESVILFLNCDRVLHSCPSACPYHARLVTNLTAVLAGKNVYLSRRLEHLSKRTLREKILSYLGEQGAQAGGGYFFIPFDRQELADYLCADRSALSRELGRLRAAGILDFTKNGFCFTNRYGMIEP